MADAEDIIIEPSESEKRIKQLSEKVRLTAEERDEKDRLLKEEGDKNTELTRERDFYQGFTDVVVTNPLAKDYKEEILAKVKGGYTVEDAMFAVLGKAGKLNPPPKPEPQSPAGGSAPITPPQGGAQKSPQEMTQEERRNALLEAQARGDIAIS